MKVDEFTDEEAMNGKAQARNDFVLGQEGTFIIQPTVCLRENEKECSTFKKLPTGKLVMIIEDGQP